ncbi:suppressor of forked protein [Trichuris suis]|nr:suppressor of forked protein [Trichuris suis]
MRFFRRREGIVGARTVFKKAREDTRCTWQVYVAAAQMELACTKESTVATKIFELALQKFPNVLEVALAYIEFLISLNTDYRAASDPSYSTPPPAIAHLMSQIPSPQCFRWPFVDVDKLIQALKDVKLPENGVFEQPGNPEAEIMREEMVREFRELATVAESTQVNQTGKADPIGTTTVSVHFSTYLREVNGGQPQCSKKNLTKKQTTHLALA